MEIIKSIIMGIVQGLTEFLPVSSSGHLVLTSTLINFNLTATEEIFFDVMLHLGTFFAVLIYLRRDLLAMLKTPFGGKTWQLAIATIPACIVGLLFSSYIESTFDIKCVFVGFYFTAFIMLFASSFSKTTNKATTTYKSALTMGIMQCFALLPGVSRSGSTLLGGVFCGVEKSEVAKFSFLMSLPIIAGSAILKIFQFAKGGTFNQELITCSIFGGISAFIFGIIGINFFMQLLKKAKLKYFSYYLFALATIILFTV